MIIPSCCHQDFLRLAHTLLEVSCVEQIAYSRGGSPRESEGLPEVIAGYASVPISQSDKQNDNRMTFTELFSACELEWRQILFL